MPEPAEVQIQSRIDEVFDALGETPTRDQVYDALVAIAKLADAFPDEVSLIGRAGQRLAGQLNR